MSRCSVANRITRSMDERHAAETRSRGGFTMTELMVVVAIIGITMLIAFIAISSILKGMQQAELDGTAKEIFIAAQNHLTTAEAEGTLEKKPEAGRGAPTSKADEENVYYFAVGTPASKQALERGNDAHYDSVLYSMLPFGSIDETVRMDGTYVIKYDYETATVLGVFYARSNYSSLFGANTDGFAFTDADYQLLFENPDYTGDGRASARQDYASASGQTVMVGYYGGEDLDKLNAGKLSRPKLKVINAERLYAVIENTNWNVDAERAADKRLNPTLNLIVTGDTSGAEKAITLVDKGVARSAESYIEMPDGGKTMYVYLDDVTVRGGHFAEIFGNDGFIPGENLTVQAVAFSTSQLANVASSNKVHRNSLFASMSEGTVAAGTSNATAKIANIRHLENLSRNVSGYDPSNVKWQNKAATKAEQTRDLSWPDFQAKIVEPVDETAKQSQSLDAQALEAQADAASKVSTIELWNYAGAVNEGSFMPVSPQFKLDYDGKSHRIAGVVVNRDSGNVGVFGDLTDASLHDLSLVNCSIRTGSGDAATLAGALYGTSLVKNVAAFNEPDADGTFSGASTDAALEIRGTSSVGGLVGSMRDGSIRNSAAAVYLRSTGGSAGGLLGWTDKTVAIEGSYAGGHTVDGQHSESTTEGEAGRVNVIAAINAAGLVGNAANGNLTISNSYSTASVYGGNLTGGLVGYMGPGSISGCYVAAPVRAADGMGTGVFLGGQGATVTFSSNYYVAMLNDVDAMNSLGRSSATAADANMATWAAFANGTSPAYPYDGTLMSYYNGTYPFRTVSQLAGSEDLPLLAQIHYGDWPSLETFVVNVSQ